MRNYIKPKPHSGSEEVQKNVLTSGPDWDVAICLYWSLLPLLCDFFHNLDILIVLDIQGRKEKGLQRRIMGYPVLILRLDSTNSMANCEGPNPEANAANTAE